VVLVKKIIFDQTSAILTKLAQNIPIRRILLPSSGFGEKINI
jgi:hypothetical protein